MKKLTVALLSLASLAAVSANANLYTGIKVGNSTFHNNVKSSLNIIQNNVTSASVPDISKGLVLNNGGSVLGFVVGKRFNKYALEAVVENLNGVKYTFNYGDAVSGTNYIRQNSYGVGFNFKYFVPVNNFDFYGLAGLEFVRTAYKSVVKNGTAVTTNKARANNLTYAVGVGVAYNFTSSVTASLEYKYITRIGDKETAKKVGLPINSYFAQTKSNFNLPQQFHPSANVITVGLTYNFGATTPSPVVQPKVSSQQEFNLDSDVTFAFGSSTLAASADREISEIAAQAQKYTNVSYTVVGHTDRIGSAKFNQTLSEKRAAAVAAALLAKGIPAANISASGVGSSQPVTTPQQCSHAQNRNDLIACLAPDRRVNVTVNGIEK